MKKGTAPFFAWLRPRGPLRSYMQFILIAALLAVSAGAQCDELGMKNIRKGDAMRITSPAFKNNEHIPKRFTCQGEDINPPLEIENVPEGTKSLALIVDDPDAPMGMWVHWVVFNIPVSSHIGEDTIPGRQGINDFQRKNYGGPCPPSGTHRYFFKLYALDTELEAEEGISKEELERAMEPHLIDKAELIGLYKKE